MAVSDESIVDAEWNGLTHTERAFEKLSNSELYRKKIMFDFFRGQIRAYRTGPDNQLQQAFVQLQEKNDEEEQNA